MTSQRVEVKCGERKYPFKRYEYDFIEEEDTFIGWLYFRGGTKQRVTFFKTEKTKCKLIWKRSLAIGEVEGAQRCWFWTQCQISRCFLLCYDLFEPLSSCAIEEPFNASQRVQNWLLLKGAPGLDFFDTVDAGLSQWWRHNIKRILTTVKSIHDEGFSNGNLRDMGCFVISKNTINLICIGGGESLMDKDNFEALRLKKEDLIGVKEVLEQCLEQHLPPHISLDRLYFFNMFNKNLDEFSVGIDYDQFVDKLITHPFLLSPHARLEYGFTLGSAIETANICGGDGEYDGEYDDSYGINEFIEYLNNDASLSTFQDWIQLIENLRTLASNYQGELTYEIEQYEIFWTALDYKGRSYNIGADELLRFLRNIYPHYVNGYNADVIDHYVGQVLCPGFLSMLHANVVLLKCKT